MFTKHQDADAAIRETDSDAAVARLSAVRKGYLTDPFIRHLVPRAHLQPARPPLINIGTYVRSTAIDEMVFQWLDLAERAGQRSQIVSLGAGSDTRYWRLATGTRRDSVARYIEVDFAEVTTKKAMAIRRSRELSGALGDPGQVLSSQGGTGLHSPIYHLVACDLRLPPTEALGRLLAGPEPLLSRSMPTLLLFECVLAYMAPDTSSALLRWFVDHFSEGMVGCVVYEMFGLNDPFGKVMVNNLKARNVALIGAEPYTTLESLKKRMYDVGFRHGEAVTMRDIRRTHLGVEEAERVQGLELLDEVEELDLVLGHYAVSWGGGMGEWGLKARVSVGSGRERREGQRED